MSLEAWGDGPDEETWAERAEEAGWMDPDEVARLQALTRCVEYHPDAPRAGNKGDAALVLLDMLLSPAAKVEDPHVTWAKRFFPELF